MPDRSHQPVVLGQDGLDGHFAEAYRTLRTNISISGMEQPVKTIAVTSASRSEGRTTTVVNLGIVMAQAGHEVVIVDADLRRPSINEELVWTELIASLDVCPPNQGPGFRSIISGTATAREALRPTSCKRLSVILAGSVPDHPSESLGSTELRLILADLAGLADYVLLDTPPCLIYADALLIAGMVDGVVYVLRAGAQNKTAQQRVQKQLRQVKARMLGVVLNDTMPRAVNGYGLLQ